MNRSKDEFLEILSNYQGIIHKVCLIYFSNASDREDNFQEIVYQLWKYYPSVKKKESIGSWIYAVSINTSVSRLRKSSRFKYKDGIPELADNNNIEESLLKNERYKQLIDAIQYLDPVSKSIMLLYLEELSYKEISDIIGISESNVGVRINRAKQFLKQRINL